MSATGSTAQGLTRYCVPSLAWIVSTCRSPNAMPPVPSQLMQWAAVRMYSSWHENALSDRLKDALIVWPQDADRGLFRPALDGVVHGERSLQSESGRSQI